MSITFSSDNSIVHITNGKISYVMEILDNKYLVHRYFGKAIRAWHGSNTLIPFKRSYTIEYPEKNQNIYFDDLTFEYPTPGRGDYRLPALTVVGPSGATVIDLKFHSWQILDHKPQEKSLTMSYDNKDESETLEVVCLDSISGVKVYLYYTIFKNINIITRHQRIENVGKSTIRIENAQSLSLELPAKQYEFLSLYGCHTKEANINRFPLHQGIQRINSGYGSSSPRHQPFCALLQPGTNESSGEVYGFQLIYSGNFSTAAEMDSFGQIRVQIGINPDEFNWTLSQGESFITPEAVLNYSDEGLNGMSNNFHSFILNHIIPCSWKNKIRPILLNSWEAMYYDVNLEKIKKQATLAKELGIELFVLDDGWFRKGNDSHSSMGEWVCNEEKLPGGIQYVSNLIHSIGLKFGLWFEPEAVSPDSSIYIEHPNWILHVPGYEPLKGRHEYLLDLGQNEVQEYLISMLNDYLSDGKIDYIKWDMNRPFTDVYSSALPYERQGETAHRYILGLYRVLDEITFAYPDVLFEGCSSGGCRFDAGMLRYFPQNWTSDNTDACDRVQIQNGFSLIYPQSVMCAHVSITPNHQTGRTTPLDTRYQICKLFNLGYELDLTKCSKEELSGISEQIKRYKEQREWSMTGTFYHGNSPDNSHTPWMTVSKDKTKCHAVIFQKLYNPLSSHAVFPIYGLCKEWDYRDLSTNKIYGGDELTQIGIPIPLIKQDFVVFNLNLIKV